MEEDELLARLYPRLDDRDAILPRSWSTKDKYSLIGLSQANLRVHYKGIKGRGTPKGGTSPQKSAIDWTNNGAIPDATSRSRKKRKRRGVCTSESSHPVRVRNLLLRSDGRQQRKRRVQEGDPSRHS